MSRDGDFDPFLDDVKGVKSTSKKDKPKSSGGWFSSKERKKKKDESLYGPASFDFGDKSDDDDTYSSSNFSGKDDNNKQEKVTIQTLFEFKPWEIGVLLIELLLVAYLVLVVTRVIPIF